MSETRHFRTSPRPRIACQVTLRRQGEPAGAGPIISYTKDLGSGGLFFVTDQQFDAGERVTVVLSTPSTWEPLTLGAEVAWARPASGTDPAGVGLQFVDLEPEQLLALTEFVASLDFEG